MEGAVVSDDLAGEKCQTDDDQEKRVETGAGDEQTGPETTNPLSSSSLQSLFSTQLGELLWQLAGQNRALQTNCQESEV